MSATIPRGFDDLAMDAIVSALIAFRDREVAIDPGVSFQVGRDLALPHDSLKGPVISIEASSDAPSSQGSAAAARMQTLTIDAICICPVIGTDAAASLRFAYLKAQTLAGLTRLIDTDLGFDPGVIARRVGLTWTRLALDDRDHEIPVLIGKWSFDISYLWRPEDITGTPLEAISIDSSLWSADYPIGGTP